MISNRVWIHHRAFSALSLSLAVSLSHCLISPSQWRNSPHSTHVYNLCFEHQIVQLKCKNEKFCCVRMKMKGTKTRSKRNRCDDKSIPTKYCKNTSSRRMVNSICDLDNVKTTIAVCLLHLCVHRQLLSRTRTQSRAFTLSLSLYFFRSFSVALCHNLCISLSGIHVKVIFYLPFRWFWSIV